MSGGDCSREGWWFTILRLKARRIILPGDGSTGERKKSLEIVIKIKDTFPTSGACSIRAVAKEIVTIWGLQEKKQHYLQGKPGFS